MPLGGGGVLKRYFRHAGHGVVAGVDIKQSDIRNSWSNFHVYGIGFSSDGCSLRMYCQVDGMCKSKSRL